jgi:hypothetical protein
LAVSTSGYDAWRSCRCRRGRSTIAGLIDLIVKIHQRSGCMPSCGWPRDHDWPQPRCAAAGPAPGLADATGAPHVAPCQAGPTRRRPSDRAVTLVAAAALLGAATRPPSPKAIARFRWSRQLSLTRRFGHTRRDRTGVWADAAALRCNWSAWATPWLSRAEGGRDPMPTYAILRDLSGASMAGPFEGGAASIDEEVPSEPRVDVEELAKDDVRVLARDSQGAGTGPGHADQARCTGGGRRHRGGDHSLGASARSALTAPLGPAPVWSWPSSIRASTPGIPPSPG